MKKTIVMAFGIFASLFTMAHAQNLPPSDLAEVTAEAGDREVVLTWEAAEDDGFITGYRVYYGSDPVVEEDDSYADDTYTSSTDTTYTVNNLLNGVDYYFSVTAIDDDQEESINYSNEVSAKPVSPGGDTDGPKVISATHTAPNEVTLVMSETTAEADPSAFLVSDQETFDEVFVESLRYNSENIIFTLPVDSLVAGYTYDITATSAVEDLAGNPVSSGITDTVSFVAVDSFPEPEPIIEEEPVIEDIIEDEFEDIEDILEEIEAPIVVAEPEPIVIEEEPVKPSAPDNTAPLEAQNLQADTSEATTTNQVIVSWDTALDIDSDIIDQVLYTRTGIGAWDNGYSLGKEVSLTTIDVQPNQNYQIRLVTVDENGNASEGAVFSFSTGLNETGPGTVIALALAFILGMMMLLSRRRTA